jgi:DNA gyrase subunit A
MAIRDIREAGRATQGVRLIRLMEGDQIAAVTKVAESEEEIVEGVEGEEIVEAEGGSAEE